MERPASPRCGGHTLEPQFIVPALGVSPEDELGRAEMRALLREAVGHLPAKEREVIEGHYFAGYAIKQMAARTGLTESGVTRMLKRAVQRMSAELQRRRLVSGPKKRPKA